MGCTMNRKFTVADAARKYGKDDSMIRRICAKYHIGTITRGWELTASDIRQIGRVISIHGRHRKKRKA